MKRTRSAILALFVALLCAMLAPMAPARAASAWDDVLVGSPTTVVSDGAGSADIGTQLVYLMDNVIGWGGSWPTVSEAACMSRVASFKDAVQDPSNHYWGLFQAQSGSTRYLTLRWTDNATSDWILPRGTTTPYFRIGSSDFITFWYDASTTSSKAPIPNSYVGPYAACSGINNPRIVDLAASQYGSSVSYGLPVFVTGGVQYPAGYEGPVIPQTWSPPTPTYVAMGDSFSSGEGNPPFEAGTDEPGVNECHRSPMAYPRLLEAELGQADFVACSGATTNDVLYGDVGEGNWGEGPQLSALSEDTEVVTVTIGGNDVGFADYAYACTITTCGPGTFDYNYVMGAINDSAFYNKLVLTYELILEYAPNAQVFVLDYPYMATEDSDVCGQTDLTGAWAVQSQLNAVIEDAVNEAADGGLNASLHYVDSNQAGSPFIGKHLCSGGVSDFNGLDVLNTVYSFHPNSAGQQDYASLIAGAM